MATVNVKDIANKLKKVWNSKLEQISTQERNVQFGIIINKEFITKDGVTTLAEKFDKETAQHIVNSILYGDDAPVYVDI